MGTSLESSGEGGEAFWALPPVMLNIWSLATVVMFLARVGVIKWPWQMEWCWFAVWHFIFYLALGGIAHQWGPSDNSGSLSHQMQLSVVDDDIEVDLEMVDVEDNEVADP